MIELRTCPVCGGKRLVTLLTTTSVFDETFPSRKQAEVNHILDYVLGKKDITVATLQCGTCRHIFISPTFSGDEIARMYSGDAMQAMSTFYEKAKKTASKDLAAGSAPQDDPVHARRKENVAIRRRFIHDMTTAYAKRPIAKLLDIGGGDGKNIIDFTRSEKYVYDLKISGMHEGVKAVDLDEAKALAPFDLLVSTHTFEHLVDPAASLMEYERFVAPGSLFYVEVPSDYMNVLVKKWTHPFLKRGVHIHWHINYFSPTSLRMLFESAGYEAIRIKSQGLPYGAGNLFVLTGVFRYTGIRPARPVAKTWYTLLIRDLLTKGLRMLGQKLSK